MEPAEADGECESTEQLIWTSEGCAEGVEEAVPISSAPDDLGRNSAPTNGGSSPSGGAAAALRRLQALVDDADEAGRLSLEAGEPAVQSPAATISGNVAEEAAVSQSAHGVDKATPFFSAHLDVTFTAAADNINADGAGAGDVADVQDVALGSATGASEVCVSPFAMASPQDSAAASQQEELHRAAEACAFLPAAVSPPENGHRAAEASLAPSAPAALQNERPLRENAVELPEHAAASALDDASGMEPRTSEVARPTLDAASFRDALSAPHSLERQAVPNDMALAALQHASPHASGDDGLHRYLRSASEGDLAEGWLLGGSLKPDTTQEGEKSKVKEFFEAQISPAEETKTQDVKLEDPLAMSSASYFSPYMRRNAAPKTPTANGSVGTQSSASKQAPAAGPAPVGPGIPRAMMSMSPFPMSHREVMQKKLHDVMPEVTQMCKLIAEAKSRGKIHQLELQQVRELADGVRQRSQLPDEELQEIGWPGEDLARLEIMAAGFERWQRCEESATAAMGSDAQLSTILEAINGLLSGWCELSAVAQTQPGSFYLDVGLERRAKATVPIVSALLDQAMAQVRGYTDNAQLRYFEVLLQRGLAEPRLEGLGVAPLLQQSMRELKEQGPSAKDLLSQSQYLRFASDSSGEKFPAPPLLWQSITSGDVATVETIIYQGGLASGRTTDPQGHTVLWDALAFQQTEIATLLLSHFPPEAAHGVDMAETHARNGNCLLHLASGITAFTKLATELFRRLFFAMPEVLRTHRNARGQTFVHIAAAKLNIWVLKFAASQGLDSLFSDRDTVGWCPRRLLERHLAAWKVAEAPPPPRLSGTSMPSWCPLGNLQPPALGSAAPPFADVIVEVDDAVRGGRVQLFAHRVVLAACSPVWKKDLALGSMGRSVGEAEQPPVLRIDPKACSSAEVALLALRFLYTGDASATLEAVSPVASGSLMMQLIRLCSRYGLPAPLAAWAKDTLLQTLGDPRHGDIVVQLMRNPQELSLPPRVRQFIARCFIAQDAAWHVSEGADRARLLVAAIDELQPCFSDRAAGSL